MNKERVLEALGFCYEAADTFLAEGTRHNFPQDVYGQHVEMERILRAIHDKIATLTPEDTGEVNIPDALLLDDGS